MEACTLPADGVIFYLKKQRQLPYVSESLLKQDHLMWTLTFYSVNVLQNLVGEHVSKSHLPKKTIFITYKSRFVCVKSEKYVY